MMAKEEGNMEGGKGRTERNKKEDIKNIRHKNERVQISNEESRL